MENNNKDNMAYLPESIANQPLDPNPDLKHWEEVSLPLVRKVFSEMKPNGVLFKLDDGQLCVALIKDGKWNWNEILHLNMDEMADKYDDLSTKNPFEYVFIRWGDKQFTTMNQKTTFPNMCFSKLYESGVFCNLVEDDYKKQYGDISTTQKND